MSIAHYPVIVTGTASAKKGDAQPWRAALVPPIPYPDMESRGAFISWRNLGSLNSRAYPGTVSLPATCRVYFLRTDGAEMAGDRRDHAGYETNAPAFMLRGQPIREVSANIERVFNRETQKTEMGVVFDTGYGSPLTPAAREWLERECAPAILAAYHANAATLKEWAVAQIKAQFAAQLAQAWKALDNMETEAAQIVAKLEG